MAPSRDQRITLFFSRSRPTAKAGRKENIQPSKTSSTRKRKSLPQDVSDAEVDERPPKKKKRRASSPGVLLDTARHGISDDLQILDTSDVLEGSSKQRAHASTASGIDATYSSKDHFARAESHDAGIAGRVKLSGSSSVPNLKTPSRCTPPVTSGQSLPSPPPTKPPRQRSISPSDVACLSTLHTTPVPNLSKTCLLTPNTSNRPSKRNDPDNASDSVRCDGQRASGEKSQIDDPFSHPQSSSPLHHWSPIKDFLDSSEVNSNPSTPSSPIQPRQRADSLPSEPDPFDDLHDPSHSDSQFVVPSSQSQCELVYPGPSNDIAPPQRPSLDFVQSSQSQTERELPLFIGKPSPHDGRHAWMARSEVTSAAENDAPTHDQEVPHCTSPRPGSPVNDSTQEKPTFDSSQTQPDDDDRTAGYVPDYYPTGSTDPPTSTSPEPDSEFGDDIGFSGTAMSNPDEYSLSFIPSDSQSQPSSPSSALKNFQDMFGDEGSYPADFPESLR